MKSSGVAVPREKLHTTSHPKEVEEEEEAEGEAEEEEEAEWGREVDERKVDSDIALGGSPGVWRVHVENQEKSNGYL